MRDVCICPGDEAETAPAGLPPVSHPHRWAALLEWFYRRAGLDLPRLEQLRDQEVPEPYRALLVHSSDMTPTLEGYFEESLGLIVLSRELQSDCYLREVVLTLGAQRRRILYGAIRILLNHLPSRARARVLEEQFPLGHILQTEALPHLSWPQAFFQLEADAHITAVLGLKRPTRLFGRRNVLLDGSRRLIAEVVEVLAPVEKTNRHQTA